MPPRARPDCKIEGCGKDRYTFPGGSPSSYCRAHLKLRNTKRRNGLERMTGQMKVILQYLREQRDGYDYLFVELRYPLAHGKTLLKLIDDDRIFRSESVLDGTTKYKITGRGVKDLAVYEPMRNRKDGLCPECDKRPRRFYSSGRLGPWCEECEKKYSCRKSYRLSHQPTDRLCGRCKKKPCHRYPGGSHSAYCTHCATIVRRKNARKIRREQFKAVMAGGPVPMCKRCKVQPRVVHPHCLSEYCPDCKREVEGKARLRRLTAQRSEVSHA